MKPLAKHHPKPAERTAGLLKRAARALADGALTDADLMALRGWNTVIETQTAEIGRAHV